MFIRAKYVLQFSRRNDLQNTGIDPVIENLDLYVWSCGKESSLRKQPFFFAPGPSGVSRLFS